MDDLKIKIDNNLDELVDLFGQLGCRYFNHTCTARNYLLYEDGVVFFCKLKKNFNESKAKEVTINQLKDMVVLKRNDLSDANAYCHDNDEQYYITSSGEYFFYLVGDSVSKWIESSNDISYLRKYVKPIQNNDLPFDSEESLNDKVASAEVAKQKQPNKKTIDAMIVAEGIINKKHSHYKKDVSQLEFIDVYRVLGLFEVESHAVGHAIKKLLCGGQRGAKDKAQDIQEAIDSLNRELEIMRENESSKD